MDMNHDARESMNRWHTRQKTAERRIINFNERINLRLEAIRERMVTHRHSLVDWQIRHVYYHGVGQYEDIDTAWRDIKIGETWGGENVSAFFRRTITVPDAMDGQRLFLRIYLGGDSLLSVDGVPYHGLDPFRDTVLLKDKARAGDSHLLELESYVFWYPAESTINIFRQAELVTIDAEIEQAYWDFVSAFKMLFVDSLDSKLRLFIETELHNALRAIPVHEPDFDVFKTALLSAQQIFRQKVYQTNHYKHSGKLHLVGHSHLDIVYHWEHHEYIRKIGRTHATMLRLIEQYPDFKFSQSSAKIYSDMKAHYPDLYEQVKQRIAEGSWQPVGAFWLEPDCNLISGESFVRHILHGQKFWQEEFGFQSKVCWQPDVFGMSWALPQILKRSGIEVALTNKLFVWNDTNPWCNNTFRWQGMDGSQVLGVIPPGHFIGFVDPDHMTKYWDNFSDKETIGETIYTYGWGDGGGGVDPEMLESAKRYADFPGLVATQFNHPEDTLLHIAQLAEDVALPIWNDELYLETHRGTYTSKGRLKKENRQSEILLQQVEILASIAWLRTGEYPEASLDTAWKILMNTQFHDALPGTHVTKVYQYLLNEYQALREIARPLQASAIGDLFTHRQGDNVVIINTTLQARDGIITLPAEVLDTQQIATDEGVPFSHQRVTALDGQAKILVQIEGTIPAVGYRIFTRTHADTPQDPVNRVIAESHALENRYIRAEFNDKGELTSLWDKEAQRQVIVAGEVGNKFQIYEDQPGKYDAWDIVASYIEYELPIVGACSLTIDEQGTLRASLKLVRTCYDSTITQRISLCVDARQLQFETEIDWHERQKLLKVGFPVNINARYATYDIAYGNIERATHRNTSHDKARFEVPAHQWMDISERGYGVSLLNDSKYGHEANHHWMRLTLLKGSISPDPVADREVHHFTYALYPHRGDWRDADVIDHATRLNVPLIPQRTATLPQTHQFMRCDASNITLEAIKRSENGEYLIVRLVEQHNQQTCATLIFSHSIAQVYTCDLMENIEHTIDSENNQIRLQFNPYEIITLAIKHV